MSDAATQIATAERLRDIGDFYEAALHQRRAIALLRDGDLAELARAIRQLVEILVAGGMADEATVPVAELLASYQAHPDLPPPDRAAALRCAALHATAMGDDETATSFWASARTRYDTLGMAERVAEAEARIAALRS